MANQPRYKCFVMMPFGDVESEEHDRYLNIYNRAIQPAEDRLGGQVAVERADFTLKAFELADGVHMHLREADFCLADITNRNTNVLYEMGFAKALGIEVIVISQDPPPYPVDIAHLTVIRYAVPHDEDGESWDRLSQKIASLMRAAVTITRDRVDARKSDSAYNVTCFEYRSWADINKAIQRARGAIDILQWDLGSVKTDNLRYLVQALRRRGHLNVRVLTLDPRSPYSAASALRLGITLNEYQNQLHRSIHEVASAFAEFPEQAALRIYNDHPIQITYHVDASVYVSTIAKNYKSRALCTFLLDQHNAGVERSYVEHFNTMWALSTDYQ